MIHLHRSKRSKRSASRVRGVVMLETMIALPIVLLFCAGISQLALAWTAKLIVQHAAHRAARAAIVVLDGDPANYSDSPQNIISYDNDHPRMSAIRRAAYAPLSVLALPIEELGGPTNLKSSFKSGLGGALTAALGYSATTTAITMRSGEVEMDTFAKDGAVTVHVAYLFPCRVPFAAAVMCKSYIELLLENDRLKLLENAESLELQRLFAVSGARFMILEGEETLPNQGAYYPTEAL